MFPKRSLPNQISLIVGAALGFWLMIGAPIPDLTVPGPSPGPDPVVVPAPDLQAAVVPVVNLLKADAGGKKFSAYFSVVYDELAKATKGNARAIQTTEQLRQIHNASGSNVIRTQGLPVIANWSPVVNGLLDAQLGLDNRNLDDPVHATAGNRSVRQAAHDTFKAISWACYQVVEGK